MTTKTINFHREGSTETVYLDGDILISFTENIPARERWLDYRGLRYSQRGKEYFVGYTHQQGEVDYGPKPNRKAFQTTRLVFLAYKRLFMPVDIPSGWCKYPQPTNQMNQTKDIQTLTGELSRLLEAKANLNEFHDALWDAGIKLEPALMEKAREAVEIQINEDICRVKAELKELL